MANQLGPVKHHAKVDQDQLEAEGGWIDAGQVVYFSTTVVASALGALRLAGGVGCMKIGPTTARPAKVTAWKLHNALLVALNFGYMPPIRPSVLTSLVHPSMACIDSAMCARAGCTIKNCKGNRVEKRGGHYHMVLPHHKNGRKWENKVVQFQLPRELHLLLEAWIDHGWHYLRKGAHVRTLLLNSNGEPLTSGTLGSKWKAMLRESGIQACFPPRRLRHIFVTDRMENPDVPGPADEHAAVVMGNSVKAWRKHYHTMHEQHGSQAAVDGMQNYRGACLARLKDKHAHVQALLEEEQEALGLDVATEHVAKAFEELDFLAPLGVVDEDEEEEELARAADLEAEAVMHAFDAGDAEFEEDSDAWEDADDIELALDGDESSGEEDSVGVSS